VRTVRALVHAGSMQEISIEPRRLDQLAELLSRERADQLARVADRARRLLDGRTVWNVKATAHGGGVAEMLQSLLAYVRGVEVDARWLVLSAGPDFFTVTKRLHNRLHGSAGDGGPLGDAEHAVVAETLASNLDEMRDRVRPHDIVLLHDPQTAGMVDGLRATGAKVVWRCHIGSDTPDAGIDEAWEFVRPFAENADAFVFSRMSYAPGWSRSERLHIITPSIDPLSAKNAPLSDSEVASTLARTGLVTGRVHDADLGFTRRDGARGATRSHAGLLDRPALPADARLVIQVSRWDRLKDMAGVLTGFSRALPDLPDDVHLLLVGPEASGVSDDPEGAQVLAECRELRRVLDRSRQERIHLVELPMDDVDENAHIVNALQRHASVIVQKSLVEGFGLTVTEAMWKARPIVASAIGGIRDQITDGEQGLLLQDPRDLTSFAAALIRLVDDAEESARLGKAAQQRVQDRFLGDRHLEQYVDLFQTVLAQ
jgi:trehalose synthase